MKIDKVNISNEAIFNAIYNHLREALYQYAYSLYNEENICEDIVQEVFISLWEKSKTVEILNIEAYLFTAIKYKVASHIRGLKLTSKHLLTDQNSPQAESIERNLEYREFERNLLSEIDKLTPKCKKVFLLNRFDHVSNTEIALKLDISIRTVEKHISDAIRKLKSSISLN